MQRQYMYEEDYERLRKKGAFLEEFETTLDAASNILQTAEALHTNTSINSVRLYLHDSFSGRLISEVLVFFEAIGSRPKLQRIFIGSMRHNKPGCIPTQVLLLTLIQANQLQLLELCGVKLFAGGNGTSDFTTLGESLNNHPSLEEVKIYNCRLYSETESADQLQDLYALDPLVKALATIRSLKKIALNASAKDELGKISKEGLGLLFSAPSCNLQAIGLLGFSFNERHAQALVRGLCCCTSDNDNDNRNDSSTTTSINKQNTSSLKELCLGTICIGTHGDEAFAQILQSSSLEYVDLKLEANESPLLIAQALEQRNTHKGCVSNQNNNRSLRHLFIHGKISLASQSAFARAIQSNCVLESLELMDGSIFLDRIRFYLRMNAMGRGELFKQVISSSTSRVKWVDALVSQRGDLSAIFYLLSMNPLLCSTGG